MTRRLSLFTLVVVLAIGSVVPAFAGDAEDDLAAVKSRITALEQEIQNSSTERSDLAKEVVAAEGRLESAQSAVDDAQRNVDDLAVELAEREAELAEVRAELAERFIQLAQTRAIRDEAQDEAESSVLFAYMRGGTDEPSIAFSASEIAEISVGIGYLDVLTGNSSAAAFAAAAAIVARMDDSSRSKDASSPSNSAIAASTLARRFV
jgi:septal ring factor EnvC (AmiA/AmiB activator)